MKAAIARILLATAALSVLASPPSGAGQHFGIAPGDVAAFGTTTGSTAAAKALLSTGEPASGVFFQGASLSVGSTTGLSIVTVSGCVDVQSETGVKDGGCFKNQKMPMLFDPLIMQPAYQMSAQIPNGRGQNINVSLTFAPVSELTPFLPGQIEPPLLPDFTVRADAGIGRFAHVTGTIDSPLAGHIDVDTNGSLRHNVGVSACSSQGSACF